jgi:hypothetical protein
MSVVVLGIILLIIYPSWFAYIYEPTRKSQPLSRESIVFILGFGYFEKDGVVTPGLANQYLAQWAEENADNISLILTQKAVSEAFDDPSMLKNGSTPVYQMHAHRPDISPVRTLEALACALERFEVPPKTIVLVAHPKHYERALTNLEFLYPEGEIIRPLVTQVPYRDDSCLRPLSWAFRELYIARPFEFLQRRLNMVKCREKVTLQKIVIPK